MQIYLDTSALVKLVVTEPESSALRSYLGRFPADTRFTAALSRTELIRAVARQGSTEIVAHARRVLSRLDTIALNTRLLDSAAMLEPLDLRTLDAIHLAAARTAPALRSVVTFDHRMAAAAMSAGLPVAAPS